eukprot:Gb_01689 [translate_table: standard]
MDLCWFESQAKRPCCEGRAFEPPAYDREDLSSTEMDQLLEDLLKSSESDVLVVSLERLMEKRVNDKEKAKFLERSLDLGCRLQEAAKKLVRQRATYHNSAVWPLTHDLTVKWLIGLTYAIYPYRQGFPLGFCGRAVCLATSSHKKLGISPSQLVGEIRTLGQASIQTGNDSE